MMSDIDILITLSRESNEIPLNKNSEIGFFWVRNISQVYVDKYQSIS